ncbi:tRNA uridine-5-carboxymethylaminomethyl(34) synthesis enzyme MnmG [Desulfovibrio sp. JC022]|uniref:tRNA uridine-5-carboxymethylaminomethyl(34) synthesis enzyme MnmG n=1 Tax=Desulfovibrio sp. JC022 TaxID=2593642 RepID=UPI0013D1E80E|nr:tRNA uridine-5-carboxymethylaminomethyl(34) synthesis enzyme MnmG [Desulfovibrio sp. JC022]NDV23591.1 tRNA uridine-5-carboxymethylaminomethyl(34) synthesis enzyme MnmG [Desulfovibrio sp. JC022]
MIKKSPPPAKFDLIVCGAGHAGCEAAMAAANLGLKTLLLTINVDRIGHLSCNPAIGGLAKGHMVKEIDALGGYMGMWSDKAGIQFRILNTRKGPAVRASRAQMDRNEYMRVVQKDIFAQDNLWVRQAMAESLIIEDGKAAGVVTQIGEKFHSRSVMLTTGTFLQGLMHIGLENFSGGRMGDPASVGMSKSLEEAGLTLGRLKTGTTPRLLKDSIDYDKLEEQHGDNPPQPFSFRTKEISLPQVSCHITYTNEKAHEAIRSGFERSPMFTGVIKGTGARYCPSIEDKVARFPEKDRHQIFLEPEGYESPEVYPSGIPTSLPLDVQKRMIHSIVGLEQAQIVRPGYAIEYDFVPPTQLLPTLETKVLPGLYLAGQINGTSGYEEAAAQGLWAACNAFCKLTGRDPFLLSRDQAYIAVLVDDLVTKGTQEPYRMFTSRAEYRLLLREGNADLRLTEIGRELGLVKDEHWALYSAKKKGLDEVVELMNSTRIKPDQPTREIINEIGGTVPNKSVTLSAVLRQPELSIEDMKHFRPEIESYADDILTEAETQIKYEGYLVRQQELVDKFRKMESVSLPEEINYSEVSGLTREAVEKLTEVRPLTLGQASRISGITPAAVSSIEIHLKKIGAI